jgi:hypothetical protein
MADTESNMLTSGLLLESRFQSAATIQSFETMHGSAEVVERRDPPGFGVDTPGAAEGGPQRVLIDLTGGNSGSTLIGKRNRSKRSKSYDEDNSEDEYVRQAKRYVSQKKGGVLMRGHNRQVGPGPVPSAAH